MLAFCYNTLNEIFNLGVDVSVKPVGIPEYTETYTDGALVNAGQAEPEVEGLLSGRSFEWIKDHKSVAALVVVLLVAAIVKCLYDSYEKHVLDAGEWSLANFPIHNCEIYDLEYMFNEVPPIIERVQAALRGLKQIKSAKKSKLRDLTPDECEIVGEISTKLAFSLRILNEQVMRQDFPENDRLAAIKKFNQYIIREVDEIGCGLQEDGVIECSTDFNITFSLKWKS